MYSVNLTIRLQSNGNKKIATIPAVPLYDIHKYYKNVDSI